MSNPFSPQQFQRIIFHVDMDSFYASCEISRRPEFKETPFIVGADPKQGKGRGVVVSCNYASRKFGVRSAMPISKAWEQCPQAVYVRPDFDLYERVSGRVMNLIRQFADKVEQVSIDEAYLDVTGRITLILEEEGAKTEETSIEALARSIKNSIREMERITCSIGVADNKLVAKIATDMNKPDGLTIVYPSKTADFLAPLPVSKIPGVGKVSERILATKFNAASISDLRRVDPERLRESFGRSALWLLNAANGIDESEVVESWDPLSLSGETTFEQDESDYGKVREAMYKVSKEVHSRVVTEGYFFRNIGIKVRFSGFETHTRSRSLASYSNSLDLIRRESEKMLSEFYESEKKVRLVGVKVSSLQKIEEGQKTLTEWG